MAVSLAGGLIDNYDDAAYTLNSKLPIAVTAADLKKNPKFHKLLVSLTRHLTENGSSKLAVRDRVQAKEMLMKQKRTWLQCQTLHTEIQDLVLDHRLQSSQNSQASNTQFYKMVSEMLAHAEIGDYLDCSLKPGSDVTLFSLTLDKIDQVNPNRSHKQSMLQKLIPDVELKLRQRCEALVKFQDMSPDVFAGDSRFDFAKASQLPAIVKADHEKLLEEKTLLKKDVAERRKLCSRYRNLLSESFELLRRLLVDHRLKSQPENNKITSEWLAARCDALCLKLKVVELQLLNDTYFSETVNALTVIRSELDKSEAETENELQRVTAALRAYESVGIEFDSVVDEFSRLRAEVDNRRWALRELKTHASSSRNAEDAAGVNRSFLS